MSASVVIPTLSCLLAKKDISSSVTYSLSANVLNFHVNLGYYCKIKFEPFDIPLKMEFGPFASRDDALDFETQFHQAAREMRRKCACDNQ
jgi:hypothetical protein